MTRLRVAMIGHAALGGSGVVAAQLAGQMSHAGHEVHLLTTGEPPRHDGLEGVTWHEVAPPPYPVFDAPPYTVAMASAIARVATAHQLNVVHVHYALPWAVSAALALDMIEHPVRLVVTLHGTDVTGVGADPAYAPALRSSLRRAHAVTTPSHALARAAQDRRLVDLAPCVVPNFVDADAFSPDGHRAIDDDRPRIVHVSNYREIKRTAWLLDALALARESCDAELLLVGDGPEREALALAAAHAGLAGAVRFVGVVEDPAPWLRSAGVFALPSANESFGLSALEAMACGLPVVGCDVGGLSEVVVDGATGTLVAPDDRAAFAQHVAGLLADRARRGDWGQAARARAIARFTPANAVAGYLAAYAAPAST